MNHMTSLLRTAILASAMLAGTAWAQRPDNLQPVPDIPPPPGQVQHGEAMPLGEPQITIIRRGDDVIREYRLNGHLYAVKIIPEGNAPPYYLIDTDGDGELESRFFDNNNAQIIVPQWVLFRW